MPPADPVPIYSTKQLALCSRENAYRVAAQLCDRTRRACIIRTGHPLQPYRVATSAARNEEVETVLCA